MSFGSAIAVVAGPALAGLLSEGAGVPLLIVAGFLWFGQGLVIPLVMLKLRQLRESERVK